MSRITAIRKQIASLEAEAERIAKSELSAAVAKVKGFMADFGVTIDHLTQSVRGKPVAKKATAPSAKKKTASVAKYADPKSGKTWSGFGRAPGWIAGVKNRDAFLVAADGTPAVASKKAVAKTAAVKKSAARKPAPVKAAAAKKPAAVKKPVARKAAARKSAAPASVPDASTPEA